MRPLAEDTVEDWHQTHAIRSSSNRRRQAFATELPLQMHGPSVMSPATSPNVISFRRYRNPVCGVLEAVNADLALGHQPQICGIVY